MSVRKTGFRVLQCNKNQRCLSSCILFLFTFSPDVRAFFSLDRHTLKGSSGEEEDENAVINNDEKVVDLGPSEKQHAKASDFEFLKVIGKGTTIHAPVKQRPYVLTTFANNVKMGCLF